MDVQILDLEQGRGLLATQALWRRFHPIFDAAMASSTRQALPSAPPSMGRLVPIIEASCRISQMKGLTHSSLLPIPSKCSKLVKRL